MAIQILEVVQNTEEWLKIRENRVTGSNSETLLTHGLEEALKDNFKQFRGNYYTERGHILEDEAIELYNSIHDVIVSRVGFIINDKFPNAGCSPDGIDGEYLIEVKCFSKDKHLAIKSKSTIPMKVMAQLQFNMMICELKKARLVMYNPDIEDDGDAYREIEVLAKPKIFENIKRRLENQR